ncbi:hypothetical protein MBLNU457_g2780t1 [Dothideomycetes sp. NU457]
MARACPTYDSDDDLPELDDIIKNHLRVKAPGTKLLSSGIKDNRSPRKPSTECSSQESTRPRDVFNSRPVTGAERQPKPLSKRLQTDRHVRLQALEDKQKPIVNETRTSTLLKIPGPVPTLSPSKGRATPARSAKKAAVYEPEPDDASENSEQSDLEESIWCQSSIVSSSEDEEDVDLFRSLPTQPLFLRKPEIEGNAKGDKAVSFRRPEAKQTDSEEFFNPLSLPTKAKESVPPKENHQTNDLSDKENDNRATIRFSPPRLQSKPPDLPLSRPRTPPPPSSPTKSRLNSPSKKLHIRMPTPPGRPSLDAFWDAAQINEWHDTYSPQKPLTSPRKNRFQPSSSTSPTTSPGKVPSSPTKRSRAEMNARKTFDAEKENTAQTFLSLLDNRITDRALSVLAESTGGIHLVWSKTLNSTAGRASWKKTTTKSPSSGTVVHHHATIELASKVLTGEAQLYNTLAHEFCHLCNFMISGVRDQPHGTSFQAWGRKVTAAFGESHGVQVTTKHKYEIEYKYLWACEGEGCGAQFGRHSKSIDPAKQRCGTCKGRLRQIRPVPRGEKEGEKTGEKKVGAYAAFVKEHYASVKKEMGKASQKEVMEAVGRKYREEKARLAQQTISMQDEDGGVDDMAKAFEVVVLDD